MFTWAANQATNMLQLSTAMRGRGCATTIDAATYLFMNMTAAANTGGQLGSAFTSYLQFLNTTGRAQAKSSKSVL